MDSRSAIRSRGGLGRICRVWRRAWLAAVNLALPPGCAFCGADVDTPGHGPLLCPGCIDQLAACVELVCRRCGRLALPSLEPELSRSQAVRGERHSVAPCSYCRKQKYHFAEVVPLGSYQGDLREAVLRMKHRSHDYLTRAVAELHFQYRGPELADLAPDVVVPIPMHWRRQMSRGTNSPEIVATRISRHLGVPVERGMLVRCRKTRPQADLSPEKRFENVRGAFRLGRGYDIRGTRVLLIDDIMTTGATCSEAAKVLRRAGAEVVFVAVIARTPGTYARG